MIDPPISVPVEGHVVWYAIDVERASAIILVVEPVSDGATG